jgi:Gpi18-like mannosyltransferase
VAFFPLYPLLIKPLLGMGVGFATAGLLVVLACGTVATVLITLLVRHVADDRTAVGVAAAWSAQPAAFVLGVTYSEALFTALSAGCLFALVKHRWLLAGIRVALASASRPSWVVLALAVAAAVAMELWRDRRAAVAVLLAPLGSIAFFGYLWRWTGQTPLTWFAVERRHSDHGRKREATHER